MVYFVTTWLALSAWLVVVRATNQQARQTTSDGEFVSMQVFLMVVLVLIVLAVDHLTISFH